jgi:hypothetical protein
MPRGLAVLLCTFFFGCGSAAPSIRTVTVQQERCVYIAHSRAAEKASGSTPDGVELVPVAAPGGALPTAPPSSASSPLLRGLPGAGLGDGTPRGLLRLAPAGSAGAAAEVAIPAAELVVIGGAVIAAVGSGVLVCATADAAADGEKTPIDIADKYYGTHFSDVFGWVQGQYPPNNSTHSSTPLAPPSISPKTKGKNETKEKWGRVYVTYKKLNRQSKRYYSGRTSMIIDLAQSIELQAYLAVFLREKNHHTDENIEPEGAGYVPANVDRFDIGSAVDYSQRYDDIAYWRIRGREQQLIDSHGGAWSDSGKLHQTENAVRGVAKDNPRGRRFHDAATDFWGELHPYTGY